MIGKEISSTFNKTASKLFLDAFRQINGMPRSRRGIDEQHNNV